MTGICKGRTVIITGAGGGLGRAYALAFAAEGANVVVNDIRLDAAQAVVDEVRGAGGRALADSGDITTLAGAQAIVDAAVAAFGEVHVLVNNAGVLRDRMFLSLTEDDWDTVMRVHLKGPLLPGQRAGQALARREEGRHAGGPPAHHQHQFGRRVAGLDRPEQLRRGQGRHRRADAGAGGRAGALWHHRQLPGAGGAHLDDRGAMPDLVKKPEAASTSGIR
jgi:NAD(P)-dependent dehydrogenase (short-subunit alcohol dehydrogenase family)